MLDVIVVNHTLDLHDDRLRALCRATYGQFTDYRVREPYSDRTCREVLNSSHSRFAADFLFLGQGCSADHFGSFYFEGRRLDYYHGWELRKRYDRSRPLVAVGGTAWANISRSHREIAARYFESLLPVLSNAFDVIVVASSNPDDEILRPIAKGLGLLFLDTDTPVQVGFDVLANVDAFVSGRWHPTIMALSGGSPFVMLESNSPHKSAGLLEMFPGNAGVIAMDISDRENRGVLSEVERVIAESATLRERNRSLYEKYRRTVRINLAAIHQGEADVCGPDSMGAGVQIGEMLA